MNEPLTTIEKIRSLLLAWGIDQHIEIEDEAEGMILAALTQDSVDAVGIDHDGTLVIEFKEDE